MSYLVLARKYRPANFEQLVGQPHVVQALSHALSSQRLHHAYLFTGTRGVGKTTISRILAKSLNCVGADGQGTITATPCGVCEACTAIDQGRFVDYTELDAASNRGVDEVQSLLEQAVYKPVQGRFKVFMIDEVHMLSNTAFNAMLKTLEEPPEYLKFVLATTDPQKVPVTVLSRCLQFNLRPMPPATVQAHLQTILTQEAVPFEPPALSLLARSARGSMRDALSLTDQAIAFGAGTVREGDVRQMLGSVDEGHVIALLQAVVAHDAAAVLQVCNDLQTQGSSARLTLQSLCQSLQRMAVMQALASSAPVSAGSSAASAWMAEDFDGQAEALAPLAAALPMQQTQLLYSMCLHGVQELGLAPDEYTALAMVMLRFLSFKPIPQGADVQTAPSALAEKKTESLAPPRLDPNAAVNLPLPTPTATASAPTAPAAQPDQTPPSRAETPLPHVDIGFDASISESNDVSAAPWEQAQSKASPPVHVVTQAPAPALTPIPAPTPAAQPSGMMALAVREATGSGQRTEQVHPRVQVAAAPAQLVITPLGDEWAALVQQLCDAQSVTGLVRELALQSQLLAKDEAALGAEGDVQRWQMRIERESLGQGASRQRLQDAISSLLGTPVQISLELGPAQDTPAKRQAAAAAERALAAQDLIAQDPTVQMLVQEFDATVIPSSIQVVTAP